MNKIIDAANQMVWGMPALVLVLGVGLFLSIRTGFAQLTLFPRALKVFAQRFVRRKDKTDGVSPYQALCTALAATVGTGNLAGVAGAIAIGGPGSIFWMWICAFLGMATKYAEATLAVRYRVKNEAGEYVGGPMYIIDTGLGHKWKWLSGIYCFFGVVAAFGVGNATQVNTVIGGINSVIGAFGGQSSGGIDLVLGVLLAALIAAMLLGGAKRIGLIAERLVPFASIAYLALGMGVLLLRASAIPDALEAIIRGAFQPWAVTGGVLGSAFQALRVGASRGVFTNEAGMGTASIAHAAAQVEHPAEQGLMGIIEVFLDTIVICTMTALVILCSGISVDYSVDAGVSLTSEAFSQIYGDWVRIPIALALCCFAIATVLGWGLYGARCAQYLFGDSAWKPFVFLQTITVIIGAVLRTETVWKLSEIVNGMMAIPNLIALACLTPEARRLTKDYIKFYHKQHTTGGTYENFNQRKSLRTVADAKISSVSRSGREGGETDLSSEYRSA